MRSIKLDGDLGGLAVGSVVVAVPVFFVAHSTASTGGAVLAAVAAGFGAAAAGAVWVLAGSPPAERSLRDHPLLALMVLAVFLVGLVPAIVIGG